jgi:hypothetical protein
VALHLKQTLLSSQGAGYDKLTAAIGSPLSLTQRLSLFWEDLLVVGVLLPLGILAVLRGLSPRGRAAFVAGLGTLTACALFAELKAYWEVGTFLPLPVMLASVGDVGRHHFEDYGGVESALKLGLTVAATVLLAGAAAWAERRGLALRVRPGRWALALAVPAAVAMPSLASLPDSPYRRSAALLAFRALVHSDGGSGSLAGDPQGLHARYRALTRAPSRGRGPWFGRARGYDVLVWVLETAPAQCVDTSRAERLPPTLARLRERAWIGTRHYSTYPYTSRAIFSVYSSWYPSNSQVDHVVALEREARELVAPGVVRSAATAGYATSIYTPDPIDNWERDGTRFRALGFADQVEPERTSADDDWMLPDADARREARRARDLELLERLEADLVRRARSQQRYLAAFHPQYSHGPWPSADASGSDLCAGGRALFAEEDAWLGRIVDGLEREGALERTLVVVTGDHGIRTRSEHPTFVGGDLRDLSFHVPLLVFAPGILSHPEPITWPTSHIDVAPTLLDLLGIEHGRERELGSPIFQPELAERTTFLFARNYLGVDGFVSAGQLYAWRALFGLAGRRVLGDRLDAAPEALSAAGDAARVAASLDEMMRIQDALARTMAAPLETAGLD